MKIGYPCINRSIGCLSSRTFRLKSYGEERLIETVRSNLHCLRKTLRYNREHGLLFFRITSDLVPFASHPICDFPWRDYFRREFREIGSFIRRHRLRISMHPDQFTLINSRDPEVLSRSLEELGYHADVLDAMGLNRTARIQIHVGGGYGDKEKSIARFIKRYRGLEEKIKRRLAIENDDSRFDLRDCLEIHEKTAVPVIFDLLHHRLHNRGESLEEALSLAHVTWKKRDGLLMVDYSCQERGKRRGAHATSLPSADFRKFLRISRPLDFDVMLEIKGKEKSAIKALKAARRDPRLIAGTTP